MLGAMDADSIERVEIDKEGRIHVVPTTHHFPQIYRAAMEVNWNSLHRSLCSPISREWPHSRWFEQILTAVSQEYACNLYLTDKTDLVNVDQETIAILQNSLFGDSEVVPQDIKQFIRQNFDYADQEHAVIVLSGAKIETGDAASPRLMRCALIASSGSIDRLRDQVAQMKVDWRDVIVAGEYISHNGNLKHVRDLTTPFALPPN